MTGLLHPRLAELRAELDRTRDGLLAAVASVPAELAALRPEADRWSVAEVVEHLRIVEDRTGRLLGKLGKQAETVGPEVSSASVLSSLDHYGLRSPERRIGAPDAVAPTGAITLAEGLAGLVESRRQLLELLHRVSGRALDELAAPHPLLGRLSFYQWLLFLAQHEERHASQVRATARRLSGQAPTQAR